MKSNEAVTLLEECEQGLRRLVAEAAGEGDYLSVQQIADLAKAIAALAAERRSIPQPVQAPPTNPDCKIGLVGAAPVPAVKTAAQARPADAYPKFFRRGDELVKVGWSKKERKEYNHRAPRGIVDAAGAAVRQIGGKGKMFNGDSLLPLSDPATGSAVPDYQAYVALAWLKHLGLVAQHGRRSGYTLAPEMQIDSTITASWPELPEWRG